MIHETNRDSTGHPFRSRRIASSTNKINNSKMRAPCPRDSTLTFLTIALLWATAVSPLHFRSIELIKRAQARAPRSSKGQLKSSPRLMISQPKITPCSPTKSLTKASYRRKQSYHFHPRISLIPNTRTWKMEWWMLLFLNSTTSSHAKQKPHPLSWQTLRILKLRSHHCNNTLRTRVTRSQPRRRSSSSS